MFYYLEGLVTVIEPNLAVLDCNGVGYACFATTATLSRLEQNRKARLLTYCNIREDAFDIFGFYDAAEKRCFELLLAVSGIGPRVALSILSAFSPETLAMAVINDDMHMLTSVPGVGKKSAQRIILELKDKVTRESAALAASGFSPPQGGGAAALSGEASAALAVLGYTPGEISALLRQLDIASMTTEEIVREALKKSLK